MSPDSIAQTGIPVRSVSTATRSLPLLFIMALLGVTSGCVALSIPSQRFHDPADRGGIFGDFRGSHRAASEGSSLGIPCDRGTCGAADCAACGSAAGYQSDDEFSDDGGHHSKPPEVPWPRYHPVPTRPVFAGFPGLP